MLNTILDLTSKNIKASLSSCLLPIVIIWSNKHKSTLFANNVACLSTGAKDKIKAVKHFSKALSNVDYYKYVHTGSVGTKSEYKCSQAMIHQEPRYDSTAERTRFLVRKHLFDGKRVLSYKWRHLSIRLQHLEHHDSHQSRVTLTND